MAKINIIEIERILQNYNAQGEVSSETNNSILLMIMERCCRQIDRTAPIGESELLKVCNAGFRDILADGAKNASAKYANQFQICREEAEKLASRVALEKDTLLHLKEEQERNAKLRDTLAKLTVKIEEYRDAEEKLSKDLATLHSFGVNVNEGDRADISAAERVLEARLGELKKASAAMRNLADEVIRVKNQFNADQIKCAENLLQTLGKNEEALSALSDETVSKEKALAEKLKERLELLENYRMKIVSATTEIEKTEKELDRYIKAFRAHKAENDSLYTLLEKLGAGDFKVLRDQIRELNGALDRAIEPYDIMLARLREKRQEEIDAIVERIETDYGVSLSPQTNDGQINS